MPGLGRVPCPRPPGNQRPGDCSDARFRRQRVRQIPDRCHLFPESGRLAGQAITDVIPPSGRPASDLLSEASWYTHQAELLDLIIESDIFEWVVWIKCNQPSDFSIARTEIRCASSKETKLFSEIATTGLTFSTCAFQTLKHGDRNSNRVSVIQIGWTEFRCANHKKTKSQCVFLELNDLIWKTMHQFHEIHYRIHEFSSKLSNSIASITSVIEVT